MEQPNTISHESDSLPVPTPWADRLSNAFALALACALIAGGSFRSFGTMLPAFAFATLLTRPIIALGWAGLMVMGATTSAALDAGNSSGVPVVAGINAIICVLTGYAAFVGSKILIKSIRTRGRGRFVKFLWIGYLVLYLLANIALVALLSPGGAS